MRSADSPSSDFEPPTVFDRAEALDRAGDHEVLRELIELFRDESATLLEALREAVLNGDAPLVQRTAHTLKGSAAVIAAHAASEAAKTVEAAARSGSLANCRDALVALEDEISRLLPVLHAAVAAGPKADG